MPAFNLSKQAIDLLVDAVADSRDSMQAGHSWRTGNPTSLARLKAMLAALKGARDVEIVLDKRDATIPTWMDADPVLFTGANEDVLDLEACRVKLGIEWRTHAGKGRPCCLCGVEAIEDAPGLMCIRGDVSHAVPHADYETHPEGGDHAAGMGLQPLHAPCAAKLHALLKRVARPVHDDYVVTPEVRAGWRAADKPATSHDAVRAEAASILADLRTVVDEHEKRIAAIETNLDIRPFSMGGAE